MKVHAVVVCYHPEAARIADLCARLTGSGARVVLVDNTEQGQLAAAAFPTGCHLISLGENTGIAHAQNVGIQYACAHGAEVVVFFDQDSLPGGEFLPALLSVLRPGVAGVAGPRCVDEKSGQELPATRLGRFGLPRPVLAGNAGPPVLVDIIIASGSAATRETFALAGTMDEAFFIDFVDTEWCLRCRARGVPIHVVPQAVLAHTLGSRSIRLGFLTILVHSPIRCYYQIRNSLLMFRRGHVPRLFALREATSVIFSRLLLLLFAPNRWAYLRAYLSAIRDGLGGSTGKRS